MKLTNIEDRKLPLGFRYIIIQLSGRPVNALLWFIWLWWSSALIAAMDPFGDYHRSLRANFGSVGFFLLGSFYLNDLITAWNRKSGKSWLFSTIHDEEIKFGNGLSRIAVRFVPFLSLLAIFAFWFLD